MEIVPIIIRALGAIPKSLKRNLEELGADVATGLLQKSVVLETAHIIDLREEVYVFAGVYLFVCLFVCVQHNSKSYGSIFMKFSGISCNIKIWKWFIFERSWSKVKVKIDQKVKFT